MGEDGDSLRDTTEARETAMVTDANEAREYLQDFLDDEFIEDLEAVLQSTDQVTGIEWTVIVTADGVTIQMDHEDD